MTRDPRSPEAMEAERRDLERVRINQSQRVERVKTRNQAHSERFTTPGQALASLRASMRTKPGRPERLYRCGVCLDSGWEEVDSTGRGLVRHCRRGCEIPQSEQHRRKLHSVSDDGGPVVIA